MQKSIALSTLVAVALVLSCNQPSKTGQADHVTTDTKTEVAENFDWLNGDWKRLNDKAGEETFERWAVKIKKWTI